ncbi:MAG: S41 family peptidase [Marinilabiliaceae bacterium]|nr:S41 family peptidase [Marinilabiliaceae bacterium]
MNRPLFFFSIFFLLATIAIFSQPLTSDAEQRLLSFCELYSTVKYYYPDPNLQDFPWDAFAYQGYKIATTSKNDKDFIKKTEKLFRIIAPGVQISKTGFNITHITPKDTSLYSERAFWQHRGGLSTDKPTFSNASTLNYVYKKPTNEYCMSHSLKSAQLQGKRLRISVWAKIDGQNDTIRILNYKYTNKKTRENTFVQIKAAGNDWKRYEKEFQHLEEDAFMLDIIYLFHPQKGTVYLDNLKLEVKNEDEWIEVDIPNSNFEKYSTLGLLSNWDNMYAFSALAFADSVNAIDGKYCLKVPAVQDNLLYNPASIDKPYTISFSDGYKAYVPLQLYANEKTVYPISNKKTIDNFTKTNLLNSLSAKQLAIACAIQIWAVMYHDYPYREDGFENKINRLMLQTIYKLNTTNSTNFYSILVTDFLQWINDPHARINGTFNEIDTTEFKIINLPVKYPKPTCLTENQWVVKNVLDSVTTLQPGDIILQINNIKIDSLLQIYSEKNISRYIQQRGLNRLMVTYDETEMKVKVLRGNELIDVVFSTDTRQKRYDVISKEYRAKYQTLQDSLKETTNLFYLNTINPPEAFNRNIVRSPEKILKQYNATDSLITELNQYNALILDVRGRPNTTILNFFNECMGIDLNRNSDVIKIAFYPVAQFKYDTLGFTRLINREDIQIKVPIYVLIDENTISAPERALLGIKETNRAVFIGSNTAGAAGPVCKTNIANNIRLTYTSGKIVGLDDNPMSYQGTGIAPDIYVYPTPEGIAQGRDEVLEKAIEIALQNLKE